MTVEKNRLLEINDLAINLGESKNRACKKFFFQFFFFPRNAEKLFRISCRLYWQDFIAIFSHVRTPPTRALARRRFNECGAFYN